MSGEMAKKSDVSGSSPPTGPTPPSSGGSSLGSHSSHSSVSSRTEKLKETWGKFKEPESTSSHQSAPLKSHDPGDKDDLDFGGGTGPLLLTSTESEESAGSASSTPSSSNIASILLDTPAASFNLREPSPIKEALLTKFAKLAPPTTPTPSMAPNPCCDKDKLTQSVSDGPHPNHSSPSWLNAVKGKITKTVEERYSVYKSEREKKLAAQAKLAAVGGSVSLDLPDEEQDGIGAGKLSSSQEDCSRIPPMMASTPTSNPMAHSFSDQMIMASETFVSLPVDMMKYDAEAKDKVSVKSETGEICDDLKSLPMTLDSVRGSVSEDDEKTPKVDVNSGDRSPKTPVKERRRFNFASFLDKSRNSAANNNSEKSLSSSPSNKETKEPESKKESSAEPPALSATPNKSSLRLRMMELMRKTPTAATANKDSYKDATPGPNEDPFGGFTDLTVDFEAQKHESSIANGGENEVDDDCNVEEALEADELLVFEPNFEEENRWDATENEPRDERDNQGTREHVAKKPEECGLIAQYWWLAMLPICVALFLQILPLPVWLVGFLSGIVIGMPAAGIAMWELFVKDSLPPTTTFVENLAERRKPKEEAIIVQEELERKYTWMNIWPPKNGTYDPLTYDVRRTMSVRVMLHGPWLELKFPKRNLPLRRMYDDREPDNVVFLDQKEVIDLTNCSIDLIPENLPSKRVWSKKYPIRIRTNQRKPPGDLPATSSEIEQPDSEVDPAAKVKVGEDVPDGIAGGDGVDSDVEEKLVFSALKEKSEEEMDFSNLGGGSSTQKKSEKDEEKASGEEREVKQEILGNPLDDTYDQQDERIEDEPDADASITGITTLNSGETIFMVQSDNYKTFYLFTRTSREKEEWFNRLMVGARFMADWNHQNPPDERRTAPDHTYETYKVKEQRFKCFMENYFQARHMEGAEKVHDVTKDDEERQQVAKEQVAFLNIYGARLWHDLHNSKTFVDLLREKITRKLLKIKIAQYFEHVSVTTLDLGQRLPQILSASLPWQDENGLWVNLDIEYNGICQATVETHGIRLPGKDEPDREAAELAGRQAATVDSDEEDSAEEDDDLPDAPENSDLEAAGSNPAGSPSDHQQVHGAGFKARMLENLLKSDFVARMAESEWVKKNITGKNITLQLQLHAVKGTLTLNFPPAPSDRVWYGFRNPPYMNLALKPCFGGKSLGKYESTISSVMRQLEKRLKQEFMKVLVYPNMDDEVLPFMDHVPYALLSGSAPNSSATTPSTN